MYNSTVRCQINTDSIALAASGKPFEQRLDSLYIASNALYAGLNKATDATRKKLKKSKDSVDVLISGVSKSYLDNDFKFVEEHPSSFVALDVFKKRLGSSKAHSYVHTMDSLFCALAPEVKASEKGRTIAKSIRQLLAASEGSLAADFTVTCSDGTTISLGDFRGKYVVLDFWASWCAPCRADFPQLKKLYAEYASQGLEVITVSVDEDAERWQEAMQYDGITIWHNVLIKGNEELLKKYYLGMHGPIPMKVLIDKKGLIIGRWGSGDEGLAAMLASVFKE